MSEQIELTMVCPNWSDAIENIDEMLARCLRAVQIEIPNGCGYTKDRSISVLLTDNVHIRTLNKQYRDKDVPTNVLSFAAADFPGAPLGDVVISFGICQDEANQRQILLSDHLCHLFVHGVLHLVGFNHEEESAAKQMEQMESNILKQAGYADPWSTS